MLLKQAHILAQQGALTPSERPDKSTLRTNHPFSGGPTRTVAISGKGFRTSALNI
jgi:hypothetical protein